MATETEKLYNETTAPVAEAATATATPASPTTAATPVTTPYTTGNASLDNYNTSRMNQINNLYDQQRDNTLRQLETAHNRTMSDAQAAYDKISPKYQESRNAVGAEYERQRRNNNLQAAANGLNTGAGSQMQLAASSVYQQNQAGLQKAENEALNEANRNMLTMKEQYDADIADAISKNDTQRAAALLDEYGQQYDRMQNEAKQLASYGDFSLYATLYGQDAANTMQRAWDLQNPQLAYTLGRISADEYLKMTGKYPPGYESGGGSGGGGSGGYGYGYGYGGSGGGKNGKGGSGGDPNGESKVPGVSKADYNDLKNAGYTTAQIEDAAKQAGIYTGKTAGQTVINPNGPTSHSTTTNSKSPTNVLDTAKNIYENVKNSITSALNKSKTKY